MRAISVLVVDDHPMLREGIAASVQRQPDMLLVAEAGNGREAIDCFRTHRPDVTLMDLQMPVMGGIDAIIAIRSEFPDACIVVLTTYKGDVQASRAMKAGAAGYLLKNLIRKDLLDTIRSVAAGNRVIPAEIASEIAKHVADDAISEREAEVLRRVAMGKSNREVAEQLFISEETVKGHMKNIMAKLCANDRTHAVTIAVSRGIIALP
jgi:two-component system, NarL family, response regulator